MSYILEATTFLEFVEDGVGVHGVSHGGHDATHGHGLVGLKETLHDGGQEGDV